MTSSPLSVRPEPVEGPIAALGEPAALQQAQHERKLWIALAALTVLGLVLRILAARGALWLDEAWSASFAQQVATPAGVFFRINHDNNHFLNTLWLQLVGPDAPPLLQRASSIACGTAAIPLAAAFARPRGRAAALIAALAFAVSPILVTYGAEARGYAPMMLATLAALLIVDRWFDTQSSRAPLRLTLAALLGMLAQLLMVASLAAIAIWTYFAVRRRRSPRAALRAMPSLFGGAAVAVALVLGVMIAAAHAAPAGFKVGSYSAFTASGWGSALGAALGWTLGGGRLPIYVAAAAAIVLAVLLARRRHDARTPFYVIAILVYPLAFAVLRIGNADIARYYLLAAIALLLLLSEWGGVLIARGGRRRLLTFAAIALFLVGSAVLDAGIIANRRGDPDAAIAAMQARAPGAATVEVDTRMTPVLLFAARHARYRLDIRAGRCAGARFLFVDGNANSADLRWIARCGTPYRRIARARPSGLSGTWWWLFERMD